MSRLSHAGRARRFTASSIGMYAALILIVMVVLGAGRVAQDTQRVTRLELVDAEGRIVAVLDVSTAGRPRVSIMEDGAATIIEFATNELQIVSPKSVAEGEEPQFNVSRLSLDLLHALAGAGVDDVNVTDATESMSLRMSYLQEQINALRLDHEHLEREHERDQPRGRDTSDPLRLQRVIDELQREARDLKNDLSRAERDIADIKRRIR